MAYFPMFVQLKNKKCLVIGGGRIALRKIEVLKDFEADVTVIAPEMIPQIRQIDKIRRIFRTFMEEDFKEAELVVAATNDPKVNSEISKICMQRKIPVNAVDQKEDCSFIFPSYVKEGEVVAAFSSGGQSPMITQYLKEKIKPNLTEELGQIVAEEKEKIREKNEVLIIKSVMASIALGEAAATALKNGHANGETEAALEYARKIKHEQKDLLTEQGIKGIYE